jgi:hypothetical protein
VARNAAVAGGRWTAFHRFQWTGQRNVPVAGRESTRRMHGSFACGV